MHFFGPNPESNQPRGAIQVFDYSRMEGQYFEPDEKICIIFDNTDYSTLRELPEFQERWNKGAGGFRFCDVPQAREWAGDFAEGITSFGIKPH